MANDSPGDMTAVFETLHAHYGVPLPPGYVEWSRKKYTDCRDNNPSYLWVHEAEWIPPDEIPQCDLWRTDIIPGLIPFAFTGAGDHWCWNSQVKNGEAEYEVLMCFHDDDLADVYAPSFPAWFYRNCLTYASGAIDRTPRSISEGRDYLRRWSEALSEIHPGAWAAHLTELSEVEPFEYKHPKLLASVTMFGFITAMEVDEIVRDQFGQRFLEAKVDWGKL